MTDEDYENIIGAVAAEFHETYMKNPNNELQNLEIAVEYTTFILSRFAKLVEEYEVEQRRED